MLFHVIISPSLENNGVSDLFIIIIIIKARLKKMTDEKRRAWEMRNIMVNRVLTCNPFQTPKTGIPSGANGDATEIAFKFDVGVYKSTADGIADKNKADLYKYGIDPDTGKRRRFKLEIKTRCGKIGYPSENGSFVWKWDENDFIVYFIDKTDFYGDTRTQCLVLTAQDFKEVIIRNNLFHFLYNKDIPKSFRNGEKNAYKCNIQTYYTSEKRYNAFFEDLTFSGMSWDLFCEIYKVKG